MCGEIGRLVCFDVECKQAFERVELRTREDASGQFEVVADVKEFDRVRVISGKLEEGVGAGGDHAAAQLEGLRNRARGGLAHLEIGKDHRVADRHSRQKVGV